MCVCVFYKHVIWWEIAVLGRTKQNYVARELLSLWVKSVNKVVKNCCAFIVQGPGFNLCSSWAFVLCCYIIIAKLWTWAGPKLRISCSVSPKRVSHSCSFIELSVLRSPVETLIWRSGSESPFPLGDLNQWRMDAAHWHLQEPTTSSVSQKCSVALQRVG